MSKYNEEIEITQNDFPNLGKELKEYVEPVTKIKLKKHDFKLNQKDKPQPLRNWFGQESFSVIQEKNKQERQQAWERKNNRYDRNKRPNDRNKRPNNDTRPNDRNRRPNNDTRPTYNDRRPNNDTRPTYNDRRPTNTTRTVNTDKEVLV
jgi:hypothetical protein